MESEVDDLADCFEHILNICDVKNKEEIDKMNSYLDKYVKMQETLAISEKIIDAEKKKKKGGWFWANINLKYFNQKEDNLFYELIATKSRQ